MKFQRGPQYLAFAHDAAAFVSVANCSFEHLDRLRPRNRNHLARCRRHVQRVQAGRNTRMRLGDPAQLPAKLTRGQRIAASEVLTSKDFLSLLVGDAGTGKTTVLTAIEDAHVLAGGARFLPLAPTTRARDA